MGASLLDKLRGFLTRWLQIQEGPRDAGLPRDPSMDDMMNLCCGPRLLSKSLGLHREDLSADSGANDPAARFKPRE
jgi:hypothetical protein